MPPPATRSHPRRVCRRFVDGCHGSARRYVSRPAGGRSGHGERGRQFAACTSDRARGRRRPVRIRTPRLDGIPVYKTPHSATHRTTRRQSACAGPASGWTTLRKRTDCVGRSGTCAGGDVCAGGVAVRRPVGPARASPRADARCSCGGCRCRGRGRRFGYRVCFRRRHGAGITGRGCGFGAVPTADTVHGGGRAG